MPVLQFLDCPLIDLPEKGSFSTLGPMASMFRGNPRPPAVQYVWGVTNQARGAGLFRRFFKRNIRNCMAPMERFIFWAMSRGFIPEMMSFRSISSSVSVQELPAGRGPVNFPPHSGRSKDHALSGIVAVRYVHAPHLLSDRRRKAGQVVNIDG